MGLPASRHEAARVIAAFVMLAVITGPVRTFAYSTFGFVWAWPAPGGGVATSLLAGAALLSIGFARQERMLAWNQWLILVVLLLPQCLALVLDPSSGPSVAWLRDTPWGVAFLLSVAAPLWLGLLSALELIAVEVPRVVVGAGIAGVGAVCLAVPIDAYMVAPNKAAALMIHLAVNILVVFMWVYARPRLAGAATLTTAGSFLVLSALRDAGIGLLMRQGRWMPVDWHAVVLPLPIEVAVSAGTWCLWFWLLERMSLAAFSMGSLASWTASILPGFVLFGFMSWRIDVALAIAMSAIVVALRAKVAEEQPVALGLGAS